MSNNKKTYYNFDDRFIRHGPAGLPTYEKVILFYKSVYDFLIKYKKKYKFYIVGSFVHYLHNKLDRQPNELDFIVVGDVNDLKEIKKILDYLLETSFKFDFILDLHFENKEAFLYTNSICEKNYEFIRNIKNEIYIRNFLKGEILIDNKSVFLYDKSDIFTEIIDGLYMSNIFFDEYLVQKTINNTKINNNYKAFNFLNLNEVNFKKKKNTLI